MNKLFFNVAKAMVLGVFALALPVSLNAGKKKGPTGVNVAMAHAAEEPAPSIEVTKKPKKQATEIVIEEDIPSEEDASIKEKSEEKSEKKTKKLATRYAKLKVACRDYFSSILESDFSKDQLAARNENGFWNKYFVEKWQKTMAEKKMVETGYKNSLESEADCYDKSAEFASENPGFLRRSWNWICGEKKDDDIVAEELAAQDEILAKGFKNVQEQDPVLYAKWMNMHAAYNSVLENMKKDSLKGKKKMSWKSMAINLGIGIVALYGLYKLCEVSNFNLCEPVDLNKTWNTTENATRSDATVYQKAYKNYYSLKNGTYWLCKKLLTDCPPTAFFGAYRSALRACDEDCTNEKNVTMHLAKSTYDGCIQRASSWQNGNYTGPVVSFINSTLGNGFSALSSGMNFLAHVTNLGSAPK